MVLVPKVGWPKLPSVRHSWPFLAKVSPLLREDPLLQQSRQRGRLNGPFQINLAEERERESSLWEKDRERDNKKMAINNRRCANWMQPVQQLLQVAYASVLWPSLTGALRGLADVSMRMPIT